MPAGQLPVPGLLGTEGLGGRKRFRATTGIPRKTRRGGPPSAWHTGGASEKCKISIKRQIRAAWH